MNSFPSSLADLASRQPHEVRSRLHGAFEIERVTAVPMQMSERAWAAASMVMPAPRDCVERQALVLCRDVALGSEAVVNPLRANRITPPIPTLQSAPPSTAGAQSCWWCERPALDNAQPDLAVDAFGEVHAANCRVRAGANRARQAPVSGIVFGDAQMHDLFALSLADFLALYEAAQLYVSAAHAAHPHIQYFEVFINGGARSAATVQHAHAQVVGRGGRHFAYPEAIAARAPADYWDTVRAVHQGLGLAAEFDGGIAWANLVPVKERDITAFSHTLIDGAAMMYSILRALMQRGTNSFSLTAILAPVAVNGSAPPERFSSWQPVTWRFLDRGDAHARHADIGCLELFGSAVVATDPFELARWLRAA